MSSQQQASERLQSRLVWLGIRVPFLLTLLMMLAGAAAVLMLPAPEQVALVADAMLILLVLCPAVVLLFALLMGALALIVLLRRWGTRARSPLRRLEALTASAHQRVDGWLSGVDGHVLDWVVRLEPLRSLLTLFDAPAQNSENEADL